MKMRGCAGLLAAFCLAAVLPQASQASSKIVAGVVIDVQGKPLYQKKDSKKFKKLKMNQFVYEGDTVKTGEDDKCAVAFVGGAELRVNKNSEFVMESGGGRKPTSVFTKLGQAWTRLLHGRAGMSVRSPVAVAAVRGTEADVDVPDEERMNVKVYEGLVDLQNEYGKQSLHAGMMSNASAGNAPVAPRKMSAGDFGTWQNGLDPHNLDKNLKRLNKKAQKQRLLKLQYMEDGKPKQVEIKLEKK